jgi:hypothetical protein
MKALLAICLILSATAAAAGDLRSPAAPAALKGEVLEVRDVESYTYLRLKTRDGETWAAIPKTAVKTGAVVSIEDPMVMKNFESKSLKKTFDTVVFGNLAAGESGAVGKEKETAVVRTGAARDSAEPKVAKATGANARSVAEVVTRASELKDKPVVVRGKVVKFNAEIMGKNWIHLRDGSGSAAANTNDILVTTANVAQIGDLVTVKGVVRTDRDFGSGYAYKVLIEEATLQP